MSKKIVAIIGSRSITTLNLDWYLDKDRIFQVVSGGANGVDSLVEKWAKKIK